MPTLSQIVDSPYLYEIKHTGTLILSIVRHDTDSSTFRELSFDELNEEIQDKVIEQLCNEI